MSTTSREFFERMYRGARDPWSFASSEYEQQRYATLLGFVPLRRFRHAFEPGCSIGELTVQLAARCDFVTAIDISETAIEAARRRCKDVDNVDVHQGALPDDMPAAIFDLVVFSEIGYYFTESRLVDLVLTIASRVEDGGQLLAAHWTGKSSDHVLTGQRVHHILREHLPMTHLHHEIHPSVQYDGFVVDLWGRPCSSPRQTP